MLLCLVVIAAAGVLARAAPALDAQPPAQIIRQEYNTAYLPNYYSFHYDATDGSSRFEQGAIADPGTKEAALNVHGSVRWYDSKGQLYEMIYKAGKRGYNTIIRKVRS